MSRPAKWRLTRCGLSESFFSWIKQVVALDLLFSRLLDLSSGRIIGRRPAPAVWGVSPPAAGERTPRRARRISQVVQWPVPARSPGESGPTNITTAPPHVPSHSRAESGSARFTTPAPRSAKRHLTGRETPYADGVTSPLDSVPWHMRAQTPTETAVSADHDGSLRPAW